MLSYDSKTLIFFLFISYLYNVRYSLIRKFRKFWYGRIALKVHMRVWIYWNLRSGLHLKKLVWFLACSWISFEIFDFKLWNCLRNGWLCLIFYCDGFWYGLKIFYYSVRSMLKSIVSIYTKTMPFEYLLVAAALERNIWHEQKFKSLQNCNHHKRTKSCYYILAYR